MKQKVSFRQLCNIVSHSILSPVDAMLNDLYTDTQIVTFREKFTNKKLFFFTSQFFNIMWKHNIHKYRSGDTFVQKLNISTFNHGS